MAKRHLSLIITALFVIILFLSGCQTLQQFALESWGNTHEEEFEELPPLPSRQDSADLIPLDVIIGNVEYSPPQISDDGSMILYRHMTQFKDEVIAKAWKTGEETVVPWPDEAAGNPNFSWAPDEETVLFFIDYMGDENYGLYTSNIDTREEISFYLLLSSDA